MQHGGGDQTILVFDLGGGTFDVSLLAPSRSRLPAPCRRVLPISRPGARGRSGTARRRTA
ncbi:Hsp70 family protein [Streptomyces sp. NPDC006265]|uniref:Hsp70 family protein n=1 Tax=Streptomyces sp. NPDC006265 TaxID=3156740 RepID=UPI0033A878DE